MSLTPLLAIAHQTVRQAIRSRLAATLLLMALAFVLIMPLVLRDDGTLEGRFRVLIVYTLNGAFGLVVIAALWSACAAVSTDLSARRLHLVLVKPVGAATLWVGQWLGLTALHGLILALIWAVTLGQLAWRMPDAFDKTRDGATGIQATSRILQPKRTSNSDSAPIEPEHHLRLGPGRGQTLYFDLPRAIEANRHAVLELFFRSSHSHEPETSHDLPLLIDIGGPTRIDRERISRRFMPHTRYRIEQIPVANREDNRLYVAIHNEAGTPPVTLLLDTRDGLRLRIPQSGLLRNHLRAGALLLARLSFFTALGLTAGTLFSFPVAAFAGGFWLLFAALAGYIRSVLAMGVLHVPHDGPLEDPSMLDQMILTAFRFFDIVLWPLRDPSVIPMLGNNTLIPGDDLALSVVVLFGLYVGLPAAIGIQALRRRELGAAGTTGNA